jgi:hypothetical protein
MSRMSLDLQLNDKKRNFKFDPFVAAVAVGV